MFPRGSRLARTAEAMVRFAEFDASGTEGSAAHHADRARPPRRPETARRSRGSPIAGPPPRAVAHSPARGIRHESHRVTVSPSLNVIADRGPPHRQSHEVHGLAAADHPSEVRTAEIATRFFWRREFRWGRIMRTPPTLDFTAKPPGDPAASLRPGEPFHRLRKLITLVLSRWKAA